MDRCTVPTQTDPLTLCPAAATTRRVVDGVSCALCAEHAAELDAEVEVTSAIRSSADEHRTVVLRTSDEAHSTRLLAVLAVGMESSTDFGDGLVEAWGTTDAGETWAVRVVVVPSHLRGDAEVAS